MATNFEPHECVIFVQSTEIDTHENKGIQSIYYCLVWCVKTKVLSLELFLLE